MSVINKEYWIYLFTSLVVLFIAYKGIQKLYSLGPSNVNKNITQTVVIIQASQGSNYSVAASNPGRQCRKYGGTN